MDADKRREQRRLRARERVTRRLEEGGDAAVEELDAEYRARDLARLTKPEPESTFGRGRRSKRRTASDSVGRTMTADELESWHEERDQALANSARQKAAIAGLVPYDREVYLERCGLPADTPDRCTFGQCPRRPKWMASERMEGTDTFFIAVCNEHVTRPA